MNGIFHSVKSFYPGLNISQPKKEKIWHGLRPVTPDGLPYIGRHSKYDNVLFAGGHAMLGLSLCTGTGKIISDFAERRTTDIDVSAFAVERFG
jgi:D-amino-acid dehydrogenase